MVFDASAVVCWLDGEPGATRMVAILETDELQLLHAVNLVELRYRYLRRGERHLLRALQTIEAGGILVDRTMSNNILQAAAQLKATQTPIALGDTFAVALAIVRGATLVTTDRGELQKVADADLCEIEFLR